MRFHVVSGGAVGDHKGINLPGVHVSALAHRQGSGGSPVRPRRGRRYGGAFLCPDAGDVVQLRSELRGRPAPIVAKIEKPEAWNNIEPILDVSRWRHGGARRSGRGNGAGGVPLVQKYIIRRARRGQFVITATQMLESMIDIPRPRAPRSPTWPTPSTTAPTP